MRTWILLLMAAYGRTEVVDRLALSVGAEIVTEQQILLALRTAAFLNGEAAMENAVKKRETAQKLLELALIRIEIQVNRYPLPTATQVEKALAEIKQQRFGGDERRYRQAMIESKIEEKDLRESLLWQLGVLSFIDFRFRPAVQIPEVEILEYYRFEYTQEMQRRRPGQRPPSYLEARAGIVEVLTQQRIDNLLDRWLNQMETQTKVRWVERVFAERQP